MVEGISSCFDPSCLLGRSDTDMLVLTRAVGGCDESRDAVVCLVKVDLVEHPIYVVGINVVGVDRNLRVCIPSGGEYVRQVEVFGNEIEN